MVDTIKGTHVHCMISIVGIFAPYFCEVMRPNALMIGTDSLPVCVNHCDRCGCSGP